MQEPPSAARTIPEGQTQRGDLRVSPGSGHRAGHSKQISHHYFLNEKSKSSPNSPFLYPKRLMFKQLLLSSFRELLLQFWGSLNVLLVNSCTFLGKIASSFLIAK